MLLTVVLGISSLLDWQASEETISKLVQAAIVSGLLGGGGRAGVMLISGTRHVPIDVGDWVAIPHLYHFSVKFIFDRLSVPFAILSFVLSGTIGAFASKYMHREHGFNRFFMLYAIFVLGMVVTSLAGTIETLFAGWELVGLSSALLVAFSRSGRRRRGTGYGCGSIYRVSDASLLLAAVAMHHLSGEGDFDKLLGAGPWPDEISAVTTGAGSCRGNAAGDRRRGQVGAGAVLGLAATGDGRADSLKRRVLRRVVGAPGRVFAAANQPAAGHLDCALRGDHLCWG